MKRKILWRNKILLYPISKRSGSNIATNEKAISIIYSSLNAAVFSPLRQEALVSYNKLATAGYRYFLRLNGSFMAVSQQLRGLPSHTAKMGFNFEVINTVNRLKSGDRTHDHTTTVDVPSLGSFAPIV